MTDQKRNELAELLAENQLLTHKVIACGVVADHPDATLGDRHPYSTEWNSQQAERVRALRKRHEEALVETARLRAELNEAVRMRDYHAACCRDCLAKNQRLEKEHDALKRAWAATCEDE